MLELSNGIFFEVNKSAEMIINLIKEKKTISQIKELLMDYSNYNEKSLRRFPSCPFKKENNIF